MLEACRCFCVVLFILYFQKKIKIYSFVLFWCLVCFHFSLNFVY
jgi:hypothetical protein